MVIANGYLLSFILYSALNSLAELDCIFFFYLGMGKSGLAARDYALKALVWREDREKLWCIPVKTTVVNQLSSGFNPRLFSIQFLDLFRACFFSTVIAVV